MSSISKTIKEVLFRLKRLGYRHVSISEESHSAIFKFNEGSISLKKAESDSGTLETNEQIILEKNKSDQMIALNRYLESQLLNDECIFGHGTLDSKVVFIVDYPTPQEFDKNNFFNSDCNILMTKIHEAMGINPDDTYITSVIKSKDLSSRIFKGDYKDETKFNLCMSHLKKELVIIKPQIIIVLGVSAYRLLFDRMINMASFERLNGTVLELYGFKLLATYHPSYLILKDSIKLKRLFWEVMLFAMKEMDLDISIKQDNFFKIR